MLRLKILGLRFLRKFNDDEPTKKEKLLALILMGHRMSGRLQEMLHYSIYNTYEELADHYKLPRERIRQMIHKGCRFLLQPTSQFRKRA